MSDISCYNSVHTRRGDCGKTDLIGRRVEKNSLRIEAMGNLDELNATIGLAISKGGESEISELLLEVQTLLYRIGSNLAYVGRHEDRYKLEAKNVTHLELAIDRFQKELPPLREFIIPGGTELAATLHVARTVCRRAERKIVTLAQQETIDTEILRYINRLSDLLFLMAQVANHRSGTSEITIGAD